MPHPLVQAFHLPTAQAHAVPRIEELLASHPASAALHLLHDWATLQAQPSASTLVHHGQPLLAHHLLQQLSLAEEAAEPARALVEEEMEADYEEEEAEQTDEPTAAPDLPNSRLASLLKEQAAVLKADVVPAGLDTLVPLEPHHATDYFGSQGIKPQASAVVPAQPVFQQRVHKFTDWLKQMKRTNFAEAAASVSPQQEAQVAGMAQASNQQEGVFTEAMAEVYLKQGRPDQAQLIYEKLMEMHPAKSTYFAALLEKIS